MGIDVSHLVLVTLGDTSDQVGDEGLNSTEGSNVLSVTVVDSKTDLLVVDLGEGNISVTEVLDKSTTGTSNGDDSGLDVDSDALRDFKDLIGLNELHFCAVMGTMSILRRSLNA
ncbi:hypothetical protein AWJ20_4832 [Sugiyamaella lignohabitans]|uniref:Uncharacterized protein n=1 Tax=Sugiyamaella lignohabitans TaxID=796027 RepID=A0A167EBS4_9ASCO|nr:uncharacterized protein AWJ20_4832 [Sugiyamaella lignohabitans]ANB13881.1 hypothetical protein AWJ20_4832 [Sugiyamaella lignohabitans]